MTKPNRSDRRGRVPSVSDDEIRTAVAARLRGADASPEATKDEDGQHSAGRSGETSQETADTGGVPTESRPDGDDAGRSGSEESPGGAEPDDTTRPFIKITPAREQVTPGHVVKALYGLYRTGSGRQMPLGLEQRLSFVSTHLTFEFLIHKPRATQRFDFYLGVRPYEREAFETLAANVRAMYPESFRFEIVPFSVTEVFEPSDSGERTQLAAFEGIEELGQLEGFEPFDIDADHLLVTETSRALDEGDPPELVRWHGVETKKNDWMTLLSRFSELSLDGDDGYRSPLSVLLEQALATDEPFVYQVVFTPKRDWTKDAERHKRNLKMGFTPKLYSPTYKLPTVTRDPKREVDRLREKLDAGERGGSARDRDALLEFSDRMKLLRETYGWHRHLKLLRHATRISEHVPVDIVDAREDREAAEEVLTWIHDTYDLDETPETNQNYRVAIRIFGKRTTGDGEVPPALDWIATTLPSNYDPTPDPAKMLWWDDHIRPMLDACTNDRDRAMIAVAWDSGARSGELRSLTIGNVADHKYGSQVTVDGKKGQRTITLVPSVPFLDDWLRNHPAPDDPDAPLWSKLNRPEATSYQLKRAVLKKAAEAAPREQRDKIHSCGVSMAHVGANIQLSESLVDG